MTQTEFRRRAAALRLHGATYRAAQERLVLNRPLNATARKHEMDPSYLSRVCKRVATVAVCECCGQQIRATA